MSELNQFINEQLSWFIIGFSGFIALLLIIVLLQGSKLRKMKRRYEAMMTESGVEDLEGLLVQLRNQGDMLEEEQRKHKDILQSAQEKIRGMKSNVAMKRYNAFGERGNDLSFSMAIIDDNRNGVVLTSLHNRENSYIYSKPLLAGESQYSLSPEEKEVIALALQRV
ncbi:DUF4446 family protein [Paenibacillus wynnii]|uniref:DUF4446 family protein n=1 Tax=Paenibacillus wynnii TaxID=268407 RepID=UPI00278D7C48|nr:DUF4446 family protein [Paenibacillus wynnii]MDQ0193698.1 hypothetical protein [Paenibacillus wynnii]